MPRRYHVLKTKRSHAVSFSSVWINKDFLVSIFPLSSFLPFPFFWFLSLPLSSFILCIFGIERLGEKEGELLQKIKGKNGRRASEREKEIALV